MVELIISNDRERVNEEVIKRIKNTQGIDLENLVIVPDRYSLTAEKEIFKQLRITSTFNTKVISISKLATYISTEEEAMSVKESELKVLKIMYEGEYKTFKSVNLETAKEISKIIFQLKSSEVDHKAFKQAAKSQKQKDIAQIYERYEESKRKLDQSDILTNIYNKIDHTKVKEINFYFAGFDSLTEQATKILEELIMHAKSVTIGAIKPESQNNAYIYDTDILKKVEKICKSREIEIRRTILKSCKECEAKHILNNLFSYIPSQAETSKVHLMELSSSEEEIEEIAKCITYKMRYFGDNFSDFNIMVGDLDGSISKIEKIFKEREIQYYIDKAIKMSTLPIYYFFKNVLDYLESPETNVFYNIITNAYIDISNEELSELINYTNRTESEIKDIPKEFEKATQIHEKLMSIRKEIESISFREIIEKIIKEFEVEETNEKIIAENEDINIIKIYEQIIEKINEIKVLFEKENYNYAINKQIFIELLGEQEINTLPITVDCVFIGSSESFFEKRKNLFVCGANQGALPKVIKDTGILNDEDIYYLDLPISPTIKIINKRNKQKLFFDLMLADEIFISNSADALTKKAEKSIIFSEMQKLFTKNGKELLIESKFYESLYKDVFNEFNIQNETDYLKELLTSGEISEKQLKELGFESFRVDEKINNAKELYSKNFSATQMEKYYECPFKHFLIYGIRIKENEINKFDGRDYGNYFHFIAKEFVSRNLKKIGLMSEGDIDKQLTILTEEILKNRRFNNLNKNKNNFHIFNILKKEAKLLLNSINYQQKFTDFLIKYVEKEFNVLYDEYNLHGFVDRIDTKNKDFIVIDYKSGETKNNIQAVYQGLELQLFVYMLAIKKIYDLNPVGGFYLPIGSDYHKDKDQKKFLLNGFLIKDEKIIKSLDRRFGEKKGSDIVALKLTASSNLNKIELYTKKNIFTNESFESIIEYVSLLIKNFLNELLSGNIKASPVEGACSNCEFFNICSFKNNNSDKARKVSKNIDINDIMEIVKNEKNKN